jgi:N4-gp56 family major capsid protein
MPGNFVNGEVMADGFNSLTYVAYADLSAQTTALTEGTAPVAQTLAIAVDQATATQVGGVVEITDLAVVQSPHRLITVAADKVADQAAKTVDILVREILAAGASVQYSSGAARSALAASDVITGALVKKMVALLKKEDVPSFGDGFYRAVLSPDSEYDIQTDTANGGWMDANKYTDAMPLLTGETGRYGGVRFQISSTAKVFATAGASSANVHSAFFFGPDSYVLGDMQSLRTYFVSPGGDHTDPLAQKALIGWKIAFGCMLLDANGARYVRLEHGTTLDSGQ